MPRPLKPADVFAFQSVSDVRIAPPLRITDGIWHNGLPHHVPPGLVFSADGTEVLFAGTQDPGWDRAPGDIDIHAVRASPTARCAA
jgi:hypothetical protein